MSKAEAFFFQGANKFLQQKPRKLRNQESKCVLLAWKWMATFTGGGGLISQGGCRGWLDCR